MCWHTITVSACQLIEISLKIIFVWYILLGVGILANDNPVSNNSVLLADRNNQIGTIYCSSGSRGSNIGQWTAPNGEIVTQTESLLTVVRGGGNFPGYVGLQLRPNRTLSVYDEGIYTCTIPDENGDERTLLIGLYRYGYYGTIMMPFGYSSLHCFMLYLPQPFQVLRSQVQEIQQSLLNVQLKKRLLPSHGVALVHQECMLVITITKLFSHWLTEPPLHSSPHSLLPAIPILSILESVCALLGLLT